MSSFLRNICRFCVYVIAQKKNNTQIKIKKRVLNLHPVAIKLNANKRKIVLAKCFVFFKNNYLINSLNTHRVSIDLQFFYLILGIMMKCFYFKKLFD